RTRQSYGFSGNAQTTLNDNGGLQGYRPQGDDPPAPQGRRQREWRVVRGVREACPGVERGLAAARVLPPVPGQEGGPPPGLRGDDGGPGKANAVGVGVGLRLRVCVPPPCSLFVVNMLLCVGSQTATTVTAGSACVWGGTST
ncbi:unnamed protein product, partial [Ectocarpus sp. 4 AP-2014]